MTLHALSCCVVVTAVPCLPSCTLLPPPLRRVLDLIEVVQRGGLTAPWLAVPSLVALATDLSPDIAERALKVLKEVRGRM